MSDGHMLVTFGSVEQAASDVDSVAGQIAQELQDLKTYLAPLVATWEGSASGDYQALQNRWNQNADDLHKVLTEIAGNLRIAATNYTSAETTNSSIWA